MSTFDPAYRNEKGEYRELLFFPRRDPSALPADDAVDAWLGIMLFDRLGVTVLSATVNDCHGSYTKLTFNHRSKI